MKNGELVGPARSPLLSIMSFLRFLRAFLLCIQRFLQFCHYVRIGSSIANHKTFFLSDFHQ
jgi:hypothetical protein